MQTASHSVRVQLLNLVRRRGPFEPIDRPVTLLCAEGGCFTVRVAFRLSVCGRKRLGNKIDHGNSLQLSSDGRLVRLRTSTCICVRAGLSRYQAAAVMV